MQSIDMLLINLIRSGVTQQAIDEEDKNQITPVVLNELYSVAKFHDMGHLVAHGLWLSGLLDGETEIEKKFKKEKIISIYRYEQLNYELQSIGNVLEEEKLPYIPLKGAVLRKYYREPWMRTSCDIDILVKPKDIEACMYAIQQKLHYRFASKGEYDISLYSPSGVHLELHFGLMEDVFSASKSLGYIWDVATPIQNGKYQYALTEEAFYYHQVVHMAKHFESGGCGIRFFLDIWTLKHHPKFRISEKVYDDLKEISLEKFEQEVSHLSDVWFSRKDATELSFRIQEYVMLSGLYGSMKNDMAIRQIKIGGKQKYVWSRIFLPYKKLLKKYPALEKRRWLFLYYQCKRWIEILRHGRGKQAYKEILANTDISKDTSIHIKTLLEDLGFI